MDSIGLQAVAALALALSGYSPLLPMLLSGLLSPAPSDYSTLLSPTKDHT